MNGVRSLVESLLSYGGSAASDGAELASVKHRPYVLLLKHSLSFSHRYELQRQSHWPDIGQLWLDYIAKNVLNHSDQTISEISVPTEVSVQAHVVVFVATLPGSSSATTQYFQSMYGTKRVQLLQIDYLGLINDGEDFLTVNSMNIERLDTIIESSASQFPNSPYVLIFDSITPVLMRHGFNKTSLFLQSFMQTLSHTGYCRLAVVPIRTEILTEGQHRSLEQSLCIDAMLNVSQSIPLLYSSVEHAPSRYPRNDGVSCLNAMLLRRGVRESDHVQRESIPYWFRTTPGSCSHDEVLSRNCCYEIDFQVGPSAEDILKKEIATNESAEFFQNDSHSSEKPLSQSVMKQQQHAGRQSGKSSVNLQLHEGSRANASEAVVQPPLQPNIFLQDDDPEFDDYDEEEPDDDLDI